MIFKVVLNGSTVIYDGNNPTGILDPQLEIEINAAGSFTFILPSGSDVINEITPFTSEIDVYEDEEMIWFGRVLNKEKVWNNQCKITCEGGLAYFNDSIQDKKTWESTKTEDKDGVVYESAIGHYVDINGNTIANPYLAEDGDITMAMFFRDLIEWHNGQVSENMQWEVGTIAAEYAIEKVWRETNRETTSDCLQTMCLDTTGGYFITRKEYVDDPTEGRIAKRYIDWLDEMPYGSTQNIEFGVNLLDVSNSINGADICTVLVPIGADELTINKVPNTGSKESPVDGCYHVYETDTVIYAESEAVYGRVQKTKTWSDITDKESLYLKAVEYLKEQNTDIPSIECSAAELHYLDGHQGESAFRVGQLVRVISAVHGILGDYPLLKISMSLNSGAKRVTIGTPPKKELTDIVKNTSGSSSRNTSGGSSGGSGGSGGGSTYVPVKDVRLKKPGETKFSTVVKNKVAKIDLTDMVIDIPVEDVLLGGSSLVVNKKAILPPYPTIPVTDVLQGGSSLVVDNKAIIPEFPDPNNILSGLANPISDFGKDGDLYLQSNNQLQFSFKYIRFEILQNRNDIDCIQFSKLRFLTELEDSEFSWTGVTWTCNKRTSENDPIGNSKMCIVQAAPAIVTFTLPDDNLLDIMLYTRYRWYTANDIPGRDPIEWTLSVSNDGIHYIEIDNFIDSDITTDRNSIAFTGNYHSIDLRDFAIRKIFYKNNGQWFPDVFVKELDILTDIIRQYKPDINGVIAFNAHSIVDANPPGGSSSSNELKSIEIHNRSYKIPDKVEANPLSSPTEDLVTVKIGDIVYDIRGGGSGQQYTCDLLFENDPLPSPTSGTNNVTRTYTLDSSIDNYDAVYVLVYNYYKSNQGLTNPSGKLILKEDYYISTFTDMKFFDGVPINGQRRMIYYTFTSSTTVSTQAERTESDNEPVLYKIYGIKFGGGTIVEANPSDPATDSLNTIKIGNTVYDIPGGGGGSSEFIIDAIASVKEYSNTTYRKTYSIPAKMDGLEKSYQFYIGKKSDIIKYDALVMVIDEDMSSQAAYPYVPYDGKEIIIYIDQIEEADWYISTNYNFPTYSNNGTPSFDYGYFVWVRNPDDPDVGEYYLAFKPYHANLDNKWLIYSIQLIKFGGSGTEIEANPSETATDDLTTIKIGDTVYDIPGGYTTLSDYYSTDERVVGRWTDGKPLYQKTYDFGEYVDIQNNGADISAYISNRSDYDQIIDALAYGTSSNETWCDRIYLVKTTNDVIKAWCAEGMLTSGVTIQYTKTTDAAGTGPTPGNLVYLPALYSEEEREVGVWTDGKPLYQKTVYIGVLTRDTSWHHVNHNISDIDEVVKVFGRINNGNSSELYWYDLPVYRPSANSGVLIGAGLSAIQYMNNWLSPNGDCSVTIQYTKTTDVAGSGKYLPDGQYAHHYSTSEHIVGTWIDGSTLYERTWDLGSDVTLTANNWVNTGINLLQEFGGYIFIVDAKVQNSVGNYRGQIQAAGDSGTEVEILSSGVATTARYVTLQYTKTT